MKNNLAKIGIIFLLFVCYPTLGIPFSESAKQQPIVRVGLVEERSAVNFTVHEKIQFRYKDGTLASIMRNSGDWRVEAVNSVPATVRYYLSVGVKNNHAAAEKLIALLSQKGLQAYIEVISRRKSIHLPYYPKTIYRVLLKSNFVSETAANAYKAEIAKKINVDVLKIPQGKSQGKVRFTHLRSKTWFESAEPVFIDVNNLGISAVDVGTGFHWQTTQKRRYRGRIEFVLDDTGGITVVNELPLESYLQGVIPSEMPSSFPLEALKAQAICARSEAINKIGIRHAYAPFDVCDDVHCQVFSGTTNVSSRTNTAVRETRGEFMIYANEIVNAFYSGVCGGHTENNENVWNMDAEPYLRGVVDGSVSSFRRNWSLQNEKDVRMWIEGYPDMYCNTATNSVPQALNYGKKYYRWQVIYPRNKLQALIEQKTGIRFGQLLDLVPLKRGVSGRIMELKIHGTKRSFVLKKELLIRQTLSATTLYSSCFYVTRTGRKNKPPTTFVLHGAGWGHGVGMCQIGAARMALSGLSCEDILKHYYTGTYLKKLYH